MRGRGRARCRALGATDAGVARGQLRFADWGGDVIRVRTTRGPDPLAGRIVQARRARGGSGSRCGDVGREAERMGCGRGPEGCRGSGRAGGRGARGDVSVRRAASRGHPALALRRHLILWHFEAARGRQGRALDRRARNRGTGARILRVATAAERIRQGRPTLGAMRRRARRRRQPGREVARERAGVRAMVARMSALEGAAVRGDGRGVHGRRAQRRRGTRGRALRHHGQGGQQERPPGETDPAHELRGSSSLRISTSAD
jgi:hypothetical protein